MDPGLFVCALCAEATWLQVACSVLSHVSCRAVRLCNMQILVWQPSRFARWHGLVCFALTSSRSAAVAQFLKDAAIAPDAVLSRFRTRVLGSSSPGAPARTQVERKFSRTDYPVVDAASDRSFETVKYLDSEGAQVPPLSLQAGSNKGADVVQYVGGHLNRAALSGKSIDSFEYTTLCGVTKDAVKEVCEKAVSQFEMVGVLPEGAAHDARTFMIPAWVSLFGLLDAPSAQDAGPSRSLLISFFWRTLDKTFMQAFQKGWTLRRFGGKLDEVEYARVASIFSIFSMPKALLKSAPFGGHPGGSGGSRGGGSGGGGHAHKKHKKGHSADGGKAKSVATPE